MWCQIRHDVQRWLACVWIDRSHQLVLLETLGGLSEGLERVCDVHLNERKAARVHTHHVNT